MKSKAIGIFLLLLLSIFILSIGFQNCSPSSTKDGEIPEVVNTTQPAAAAPSEYEKLDIESVLPNFYRVPSKVLDIHPSKKRFLVSTSMIETSPIIEIIFENDKLSYRNLYPLNSPSGSLGITYNFDGTKIIVRYPSLINRVSSEAVLIYDEQLNLIPSAFNSLSNFVIQSLSKGDNSAIVATKDVVLNKYVLLLLNFETGKKIQLSTTSTFSQEVGNCIYAATFSCPNYASALTYSSRLQKYLYLRSGGLKTLDPLTSLEESLRLVTYYDGLTKFIFDQASSQLHFADASNGSFYPDGDTSKPQKWIYSFSILNETTSIYPPPDSNLVGTHSNLELLAKDGDHLLALDRDSLKVQRIKNDFTEDILQIEPADPPTNPSGDKAYWPYKKAFSTSNGAMIVFDSIYQSKNKLEIFIRK